MEAALQEVPAHRRDRLVVVAAGEGDLGEGCRLQVADVRHLKRDQRRLILDRVGPG